MVPGDVELNLYFSGWPFAALLGVPIAIDIVFRKVGFNQLLASGKFVVAI